MTAEGRQSLRSPVCIGLDLNGDRLEIFDQPERPLFLNTVKGWVIEVLERRYEILCKLDSAVFRNGDDLSASGGG